MSVNVRRYRDRVRWLVDVWVARPGDGVLVRDRHVCGGTKPMARAWGLERERALLAGQGELPERAKSPAFDVFAKDWLGVYPKAAGNAPRTVKSKTNHLESHLLPFFGSAPLDAIDRRMLDVFIAHMFTKTKGKPVAERVRRVGTGPKPISPKTVRNVTMTLRRILASAVEWGVLASLPPFPKVKVPEQPFAYYDAMEAARLVAAAPGLVERAILTFAIQTGARAGEIMALRRGTLDLKLGIVTFARSNERDTTKTYKVRSVPLSPALCAVLREVLAARPVTSLDGDDLVFAVEGEAVDLGWLHRMLWRAQRKAGLRRIRLHDMRHSFASILTIAGTPLQRTQAWLGHTTPMMTQRYAHLDPDGGREHLAAFDVPNTGHPQATASRRVGRDP